MLILSYFFPLILWRFNNFKYFFLTGSNGNFVMKAKQGEPAHLLLQEKILN